jgi:hypothetical protein
MMPSAPIELQSRRKKRFSDFAQEPGILDGAKMRIEDVLNHEIEIIGFRIAPSKYTKNKTGQCLTLQFIGPDGQRHVTFTGSDVLIDQIGKYQAEIPFLATIKKIDRYYCLK